MINLVEYVTSGHGSVEKITVPKSIRKDYIPTNPSCVYYNGGLYCNCRMVDYIKLLRCNNYTVPYGTNQQYTNNEFHSINVIRTKEGNFKLLNEPSGVHVLYNGLEDARLVVWNNICYAYGTRWDKISDHGVICLYELNSDFECVHEYVVTSPLFSTCEKNWGAVSDKPFTFIYKVNPTMIVKLDINAKTISMVTLSQDDSKNLKYRSNSNVVRYDNDTYIQLVHESHINGLDLNYKYAFIFYDNDLNIQRITKQFNFRQDLCEFSCGIEVVGETVYITFSELDSTAEIIRMSKLDLENYIDSIDGSNAEVDVDWVYGMVEESMRNRNIKLGVLYANYFLTLDTHDIKRIFICAMLVTAYYSKYGIILDDMYLNVKRLQEMYPHSKEFLYIESYIHRQKNNQKMAQECKRLGDSLNDDLIHPFFLQIINPSYL